MAAEGSVAGRPFVDLERALLRIPGVRGARIVEGPHGRVSEVHILVAADRVPKQVVRDVQSVALASFGIEVDYRTVSVVPLEDVSPSDEPTPLHPATAPRPRLLGVVQTTVGRLVEAEIKLDYLGKLFSGSCRGASSAPTLAVARAVADAVARIREDLVVEVVSADQVELAGGNAAVVMVRLIDAREERLMTGTTIILGDGNDAVARATLSALNRVAFGR